MPPARCMATSFLRLLGHVVLVPILVASLRFPSPKPQLQEDEQPGTKVVVVAAHKAWTLSQVDMRDTLSNSSRTGGHHRRHLATSDSSVSECILLFGAFCNGESCFQMGPSCTIYSELMRNLCRSRKFAK